MKKNGFTLIELLAVIVILAIIALIATPLVLKYIEKSRKESKVDSAYSFVRNLETEIANYSIQHNGKKYNKSGLLEIGDFTEIDTTVKGENPNTIKVCLSSLGQVEKAMFEYGKYYVSYDSKKGSISDKDTYDNFSCSGNVAGGGSGETTVFKQEVEFRYDSDMYSYLGETTIDTSLLETPSLYKLIIDETQVYTMINSNNEGTFKFIDEAITAMIIVENGNMQILFPNELVDKHTVELVRLDQQITPRTVIRIVESGRIAVSSLDLSGGDTVNIVIKDSSNNNVLADISAIIEGQRSISSFSTDAGIYNNVFDSLQNGTKTSIVITKQSGQSEIETIFESTETPIFMPDGAGAYGKWYYCLGNDILPVWSFIE